MKKWSRARSPILGLHLKMSALPTGSDGDTQMMSGVVGERRRCKSMSSTRELQQKKQELAMYKCTSDTSLEIYSPARTSGLQMAKEDSVRFQITNQLEKGQTSILENPPRATEALSENEDLGIMERSRQIIESFNMEDFWHALFLGKYFLLNKMLKCSNLISVFPF